MREIRGHLLVGSKLTAWVAKAGDRLILSAARTTHRCRVAAESSAAGRLAGWRMAGAGSI